MALGGGTWVVQNKLLPGSYVNFKSQPGLTMQFADRGYAAIALQLDWGEEGEIRTITNEDLQTRSYQTLGYDFTSPALKPVREILSGARVLHLYNLASGGTRAEAVIAELLTVQAAHPGDAGNRISVSVESAVDQDGAYVITTYMDGLKLDEQTVLNVEGFLPNGFITLSGALSVDTLTVRAYLENGATGTALAGAHSDFLSKIQGEYFNDIGYAGTDDEVRRLYEAFGKRMVDEVGYYVQTTVYKSTENHIGINSVEFSAKDDDNEAAGVYWYLGQAAGTTLGRNPSSVIYNGEYDLTYVTDRLEGEKAIREGKLVLHRVDGELRLLEDVNTFTNYSKHMTEDWSLNEVVRIVFQRAKDITALFNKYYMQKVLNNQDGRAALWADCVHHAQDVLQGQLGVIEEYAPADTTVVKGIQKGGVVIHDAIQPVTTMTKLYMEIAIS